MTFETLITILTIKNLNSWQSLWPDNYEWHWAAFAILAMFIWRMFFIFTSDDPSGCRKSFTDFARSRSTRGDLSSLATPSPAGLKQSPSHKISNTELRQRNCQHIFMFKVGYRYSLSVGQIQIQLGQLLFPIRYSGGRDPRAAQPPRIRQGWTFVSTES